MLNFVINKIRSTGPRMSLALVITVIILFVSWLLIIMMAKKDVAEVPKQEKNKIGTMVTDLSYYIFKGSRPKPVEKTKCKCFERLWNLLG